MKKAKAFNRIVNLFLTSIPDLLNTALIYFLFLFIYAVIGMNMFSYLKHQTYINKVWNFENFFNAMMVLLRVTSGDGWSSLMHDCANTRSNSFDCKYPFEITDLDKNAGIF